MGREVLRRSTETYDFVDTELLSLSVQFGSSNSWSTDLVVTYIYELTANRNSAGRNIKYKNLINETQQILMILLKILSPKIKREERDLERSRERESSRVI